MTNLTQSVDFQTSILEKINPIEIKIDPIPLKYNKLSLYKNYLNIRIYIY